MARKAKEPRPKKPKKEKPEKAYKMQSSAPRRFGAWTFVIFMLFTIAFGVFKIYNAPTELGISKAIEKQRSNLDKDTLARTKAVAFAEGFAIAYFTNQEADDYVSKMEAFYAYGVPISENDTISETMYVGTSGVEVDGDKVNVDVACQVGYALGDSEVIDTIQFVTIRVPIKIDKKGNCSVVAVPIYVSESNNSQSTETVMNTIEGNTASSDLTTINNTIASFFEVYYKGKSNDLKYYVTKNYGTPSTIGMNIEIENLSTQVQTVGDHWEAECTISITSEGIAQKQHCFLEIVKGAEGRYYINKLSTM